MARGFGLGGVTPIEDPGQCASLLQQAMMLPGTVVIDAIVDTHEPPMPPKATVAQAAKLAKALASGTPAGGQIARRIGMGVVREMI